MNKNVGSGIHRLSDLRVAVFSDAMAERNGVGTYYQDLVEHLQHRIEAVFLFCPAASGKNRFCGPSLPLPGDATQRIFFPRPGAAACKMRQIRPQIVVAATPGPFGALGVLLAKAFNSLLCVGYHTRYDKLVGLYWLPAVSAVCGRVLHRWDRLFLRIGGAVAVNSAQMALNVRRLGVSSIYQVGTPISRQMIAQPPAPFNGCIQKILFAGRLAAEKNISQVLEAAERLPGIHFLIAGDGPLAESVADASKYLPNLEFLQWVPRRQLVSVLDQCDVLVLPSKEEAFGTVALEAMARGRMVIVSSRCGILNWPSLSRGLFRIRRDERLADAISRIEKLDVASKTGRAAAGRAAAVAFNNSALEDWLNMFSRLNRAEGATS